MKKVLYFFSLLFFCYSSNGQSSSIVINEIGIAPSMGNIGAGGEFIELYNKGGCEVDIGCYVLVYSSTNTVLPTPTGWTITIPTGAKIGSCSTYLIGGGGSTTFSPGWSNTTGGNNWINSFGAKGRNTPDLEVSQTSNSSLNSLRPGLFTDTKGGQLTLYDASGVVVSSVSYNSGNNSGTYDNSFSNPSSTCNKIQPISNPGTSTNNVSATFSSGGIQGIFLNSLGNYQPGSKADLSPGLPNSTQVPCVTPTCKIGAAVKDICLGSTTQFGAITNGTYSWTGPDGLPLKDQETFKVITVSKAGIYTLTVTEPGGCTSICTQELKTDKTPATAQIIGDTIICPNRDADIIVNFTGTGGWEFSYEGSDGTVESVGYNTSNPYVFQVIPNNNQTTTYSLKSVTTSGCPPGIIRGNPVKVTVLTSDVKPSYTTIQPSCDNPTGSIIVTEPRAGNMEYSIDGNNFQDNPRFDNVPAGSHPVTVRIKPVNEFNLGCSSSSIIATIFDPPTAPEAPKITEIPGCGFVTLIASNFTGDLTWSPSGEIKDSIIVTTNGRYTVSQSINGCSSLPSKIDVFINSTPNPAAPEVSTIQPTCTTPTGKITVTNPAKGTGYTYSIDNGPYQNENVFDNLAPNKLYNITVKNSSNCISLARSIKVDTLPLPPTILRSVNQPTCITATGSLTISSPTDGLKFNLNNAGFNDYPPGGFTGLLPGTYTLLVRNNAECISTDIFKIEDAPVVTKPEVKIKDGCGTTTLSIENYDGTGTITWDDGSSEINRIVSTSRMYTVWFTRNGCKSESWSKNVTVKQVPVVTVNSPTVCTGSNATVAALVNPPGLYTYVWKTLPTGAADPGDNSTFSTSVAGSYTVEATKNGCTGIGSGIVSFIDNAPVVADHKTICFGDSVQLTAQPSGGIWSGDGVNAATGKFSAVGFPPPYIVRYDVSAGSCSGFDTALITVNPTPGRPTVSPGFQEFCINSNATSANLEAVGVNKKWYDVAVGGEPLPNSTPLNLSGTYWVTQTNTSNCESPRQSVNVVINPVPEVALIVPSTTCVNNNVPVKFKGTPGALVTFTINGNSNSITIEPDSTTEVSTGPLMNDVTYTITAITRRGCNGVANQSRTIKVIQTPTPQVEQTICPFPSKTISDLRPFGKNYNWYNQIGDVDPLDPNVRLLQKPYFVSQKDTISGCETPRVQVRVTQNLTVPPVVDDTTFCTAFNPTISSIKGKGPGNFLFYTNIGDNNPIPPTQPLSAGTYYVRRDIDNCLSEEILPVKINILTSLPPPSATNQTLCITPTPTVANLIATGNNILWYSSSTGGTSLPANSFLINGNTYYVSQSNATCESARTPVVVSINTVPAPTANDQTFCSTTNPTVANLLATGTNIKWYAANTGGAPLAGSTSLTNGTTYYASQTTGNCEGVRRAVLVTINPSVTPTVSITPGNVNGCSAQQITFTATAQNGGTSPTYQWKVNGTNVAGSGNTFTTSSLNNNDVVTVVLTSNATCLTSTTVLSNAVTVNISASATPSVSITPATLTSCISSPVTFTATPVNGGTSPTYQWKVNGLNVAGTGNTFTTSSLNNNDVVSVVMTSNATCLSTNTATSNLVTASITTAAAPAVTISAANPTVCSGMPITFTASPVNGGTSPTYQWRVNGNNVAATGGTFTSSTLNNNDVVTVVMTSNSPCATAPTAMSNPVTVTIGAPAPPSVTITPVSATICSAAPVTFTAVPVNGGPSPTYQWKVNGVDVSATGSTFTTATLNNNDVVTVVMTSNSPCATSPTATSNQVRVTTNSSTPLVSITPANVSVCKGVAVTFTANPISAGLAPTYQWKVNGVNVAGSDNTFTTSTLNNNDVVSVVMTSNDACATAPTATSNNVTVSISSPSAPTVTKVDPTCAVTTGTINITSPLGAGITYSIDAVNYTATTSFNNLAPRTYNVTAKINGCVSAVTQITISANNNVVVASATKIDEDCGKRNASITASIIGGVAPFTYAINNGSYSGNNVFTNLKYGTYKVWVKDATGCIDDTTIIVNQITNATTLSTTIAGCSSVSFNNKTYTNSTIVTDTIRTALNCDSIYNVTNIIVQNTAPVVQTTTINGCDSVVHNSIIYRSSTVVRDTLKTTIGCDSVYVVTNINVTNFRLSITASDNPAYEGTTVLLSTNSNVAYQTTAWQPAYLFPLQTSSLQKMIADSSRLITVTAESASGCIDTAQVFVEMKTYNDFFVPNAFSPNADGKNDLFIVMGTRIASGRVRIFNQWGKPVFSTDNITTGWNGSTNGTPQPVGVYIYEVHATLLNGAEVKRKGFVNLIR